MDVHPRLYWKNSAREETTVALGSKEASTGPRRRRKEKVFFITFVFLITNIYSGKSSKFHKNIGKKMNSLEYWHPEAATVNGVYLSLVGSVFTCPEYK